MARRVVHSFHSEENIAPLKSGIKHLARWWRPSIGFPLRFLKWIIEFSLAQWIAASLRHRPPELLHHAMRQKLFEVPKCC
jgi:hypothetical protein